jgi:hypothetical protein
LIILQHLMALKDSPVFDDGIVNDQPWCYLATWLIQTKLEGMVCVLPSLYERAFFFAMQSGVVFLWSMLDGCLNGHLSALDDGT